MKSFGGFVSKKIVKKVQPKIKWRLSKDGDYYIPSHPILDEKVKEELTDLKRIILNMITASEIKGEEQRAFIGNTEFIIDPYNAGKARRIVERYTTTRW